MCGRFVIIPDHLQARFDLMGNIIEVKPNYNAAPSQKLPVITATSEGNTMSLMQWGLVLHWAKERNSKYSMINARVETIEEKPSFRDAFKNGRCIIPANGFYEWKATSDGKQPYYIYREDQEIMAFAGIYSKWIEPTSDNTLYTYSIITTASSGVMESIHHRSPIILDQSLEQDWLHVEDNEDAKRILRKKRTDLSMYPVSKLVNVPSNNIPSLLHEILI